MLAKLGKIQQQQEGQQEQGHQLPHEKSNFYVRVSEVPSPPL
jgi:hypothetical protein